MQTQLSDTVVPAAPATSLRRLRVCVIDILPTVPYYTASLCASLREVDGIDLHLESVRYYLDPDLFPRMNLRTDGILLDVASRFRKASSGIGRILKIAEYLLNLNLLLVRCGITRPDILHVQFLPAIKFGLPMEFWFLDVARALGCKIVYTVHNVLPQDTGDKHRAAFKRIYETVDGLICHDEFARMRLIREFGVRPAKISVIPHGPLLEQHSSITADTFRQRLGLAADEPLILWQGILRPYKGISFLLQAWKQVQAMGVRARLVIAGNGDAAMMNDIRRETESLGLQESVILDLRFISIEDLARYYTAADLLVYPYREVTTSGALMTGIAYGKAIVATDQLAFRSVLRHGENALIVNYGDATALAECIARVIEDRSLRERLAAGARAAYARAVQWTDIAAQTMACYRVSTGGNT